VTSEQSIIRRLVKARKRAPSITLVIDESAEVSEAVYTAAVGVLTTSPAVACALHGFREGERLVVLREFRGRARG